MASTGPAIDFSSWPRQKLWWVDNTLPYGTWTCRKGAFFTSVDTFRAFEEYARLHEENGTPIKFESSELKDQKTREAVLDAANSLVMGNREDQYGTPYDHFLEVATVLNSFGFSGPGGREIMPRDVPFFQLVVKLSRVLKSPEKMDSWIDIAGYAACGAEVAEVEAAGNDRR